MRVEVRAIATANSYRAEANSCFPRSGPSWRTIGEFLVCRRVKLIVRFAWISRNASDPSALTHRLSRHRAADRAPIAESEPFAQYGARKSAQLAAGRAEQRK